MTRSGQIEIRPFPLVRHNAWLWRGCLSCLPESWLSYIPGTRQFQHRYQRRVAQEARKGLRLFRDLQALDTTTKQSLLFQMRNHENRRAIMFIRQGYAASVGILVPMTGLAIMMMFPSIRSFISWVYFVAPVLLEQIGWVTFTIRMLLGFMIALILSWLFYTFFLYPYLSFVRRYLRFSLIVLSLGFITYWWIAFSWASVEAGTSTLDAVSHLLAGFTNEQIGLAGVFPIYMLLLVIAVKLAFERRLRVYHSDTVLVNTLLRILSVVEKEPRAWADLEFRCQLLPMLEKAAVYLQHDLRRQCQSGDAVIDIWVQNATARKAAALHELKKWVPMPKANTRSQFIICIATSLSQIASGNWDALEEVEPERISRIQMWRSYGVAGLRGIFWAGFPALVFWAFQQISLALEGTHAEYMKLAVCALALSQLIRVYDPSFGAKATDLIENMQSFPVIGSLLGKHKKE